MYGIRRLMVLKEVTIDFTALYMCVYCTRKVYSLQLTAYLQMFVKVQHCTGYPLIQVEIVSVKSHYMHWLVSQSSLLTFLFLECVVIPTILQCGCRCRYRCRCRSFCCRCLLCNFCYLCIFFLSF